MAHSPARRGIAAMILYAGAAVALGLAFTTATNAAEPPNRAKIARDAKDPRWLHGTITIAAPANQVFDRLARVNEWNQVFSDIKRLKVIKHDGEHWLVELETRTMDCGAHDYHLYVQANRRVKLVFDAPGVNAHGFIEAKQGEREGESSARFTLFVEATGVIGWFIPESTLRARQESMVRHDLGDLARSFAKR